MQDNTRAAPRLITVAAIALVALAFAAFAWMSGSGNVAGAAGTSGGPNTSGQVQPIQQDDQGAQDDARPDRDGDGHPCPEEGGAGPGGESSSGSSGQQDAPSTATPDTAL